MADDPEPDRPRVAYEPQYSDRVIDLGGLGYSVAEMADDLKVTRAELLAWTESHPDFREAMTRAGDRAFAWWERKAREGLEQGTKVNTTIWSKSIGARFPAEAYGERGGTGGDSRAGPDRKRRANPLTTRERAKGIALLIAKSRAQSL